MKKLYVISKVLLLLVLFTGFGLSAQAQTPDAVFGKVATAIKSGDASTLASHFNSNVEITLPGVDKTFSAQQASFVVKDFFGTYAPSAFKILHKGNSGTTHYATGTYKHAKGAFDTNIFLKKVGDKILITQLRFEAE